MSAVSVVSASGMRNPMSNSDMQAFLKALEKDPDLGSKLVKRAQMEEFKEKYKVDRASSLKCPACAAVLRSPGTLYWDPTRPNHFVCKKCKTIYHIECKTVPIEDLVENIRLILKGDEKAVLRWDELMSEGG